MIDFSIRVSNPFANGSQKFLFFKSEKITENKSWEFQFDRDPQTIIDARFWFRTKGCHHGFGFSFGLVGFWMNFEVYDNRHFDYLNNCWKESE